MIKKILILTFTTLLLCSGIRAQEAGVWKKFNSKDGKFSILLPCTPEITSEDVGEGEAKMKQVYHTCIYGKGAYTMSYSILPVEIDAKAALDKFRDGILSGSNSKLVDEKEITLSSYPGREFSATSILQGTEMRYDWRIYMVDQTVYSLGFVARTSGAQSPESKKFLSSFAIEK
jgi:hypothetical protein